MFRLDWLISIVGALLLVAPVIPRFRRSPALMVAAGIAAALAIARLSVRGIDDIGMLPSAPDSDGWRTATLFLNTRWVTCRPPVPIIPKPRIEMRGSNPIR